jgi:hypothetical protein
MSNLTVQRGIVSLTLGLSKSARWLRLNQSGYEIAALQNVVIYQARQTLPSKSDEAASHRHAHATKRARRPIPDGL